MRTPKRPTPGQINIALGIAWAGVTVVLLVQFGGTDRSYRIPSGMVWGVLFGVLCTRLWMSLPTEEQPNAPH